jgi:hypothetical protein
MMTAAKERYFARKQLEIITTQRPLSMQERWHLNLFRDFSALETALELGRGDAQRVMEMAAEMSGLQDELEAETKRRKEAEAAMLEHYRIEDDFCGMLIINYLKKYGLIGDDAKGE